VQVQNRLPLLLAPVQELQLVLEFPQERVLELQPVLAVALVVRKLL